jgi:hypothetical protein
MVRDNSYKKPTDAIVTIPVDLTLHQRLRIQAAKENTTIKQIGTTALIEYLSRNG